MRDARSGISDKGSNPLLCKFNVAKGLLQRAGRTRWRGVRNFVIPGHVIISVGVQ